MNPKHCNVIISAYKAERWILDCLESVRRQRVPLGWTINVLIGVDGCEETSQLLANKGYTHYWSPVNVGPYIIRNSLFAVKRGDAFAVFDADDMMADSYLSVLIGLVGGGIAGSARHIIGEDGRKRSGRNKYRCGVCVISNLAMQKLGGYVGHRVAADYDLIMRARALGIKVTHCGAPLYYRRIHKDSLTQTKETGMKSAARRACVVAAKELREAGHLKVTPVVTPLVLKPGFYK